MRPKDPNSPKQPLDLALDYIALRDGIPRENILDSLSSLISDIRDPKAKVGIYLLYKDTMQMLLRELNEKKGDDKPIALCGLDLLKRNLKNYSPFFTKGSRKHHEEYDIRKAAARMPNDFIFIYQDLMQPLFRTRALMSSYYPELSEEQLPLQLHSTELGLRGLLSRVKIYPDKISLLSPPEESQECVVNYTEPESLATHPRFKEKLKQRFDELADPNIQLLTDVRVWGYTVKDHPELSQKTQVYVRDRTQIPK
jgi:hypothetical protein